MVQLDDHTTISQDLQKALNNAGFLDSTWKNDAMPSFRTDVHDVEKGNVVWIAQDNADHREVASSPVYVVCACADYETYLETDDEAELIAFLTAEITQL